MKVNLKILFMSDLGLGNNRHKHREAFKKQFSKELLPVAWHPKRWWEWYILEGEKKEIEAIFTDENQYKVGKW